MNYKKAIALPESYRAWPNTDEIFVAFVSCAFSFNIYVCCIAVNSKANSNNNNKKDTASKDNGTKVSVKTKEKKLTRLNGD